MRKPPKLIEYLLGFFNELFKLIGKCIKAIVDEGKGKPDNVYYPYLMVGLVGSQIDLDLAEAKFNKLNEWFNYCVLEDSRIHNKCLVYKFDVSYKTGINYDLYKILRGIVRNVLRNHLKSFNIMPIDDLNDFFGVKMVPESDKLLIGIAVNDDGKRIIIKHNQDYRKELKGCNLESGKVIADIEKDWGEE